MIVSITGGTGFIGRKLVLRHLMLGDEVRVLSRVSPDLEFSKYPIKWWQGNLQDTQNLASFVENADVLYHCAAEIRDVSKMQMLHVDGTQRLIDTASGKVARWVQLSSVGVYGQIHRGVVTEESEVHPVGEYENTKLAADRLIMDAGGRGAFEHVILRPSNVYGANMPNQSLFRLFSLINRGLFVFVGKQGASANYIHVENVVNALLLCAAKPEAAGNVYVLSDYRTLETFVEAIARILGKPYSNLRLPELLVRCAIKLAGLLPNVTLTEASVNAMTSRARYSCAKIERELGYEHVVTMERGLEELINSWERNCQPNNIFKNAMN